MTTRARVVLLLSAVAMIAACGGDRSPVAAVPSKATEVDLLDGYDVLVIVDEDHVDAAEAELDRSAAVRAHARLPRKLGPVILSFAGVADACEGPEHAMLVALDDAGAWDGGALGRLVGERGSVHDWLDLFPSVAYPDDHPDLEIFLRIDATDDEVSGLRASLEADPRVEAIRFLDKDAALAEFRQTFAGQHALLASTTADALPVSFRVVTAADTPFAEMERDYAAHEGVDNAIQVPQRDYSEDEIAARALLARTGDTSTSPLIEIFMSVDAADDEIAAVSAALGADPRVTGYEHLDRLRAYEEFARMFAGQPALLESTSPESLPHSFRLTVADLAEVRSVAERFEGFDAVDEVITAHELTDPRFCW